MSIVVNFRLQHTFLDQLHNCLKACVAGFVIAYTVAYFYKCNDVGWWLAFHIQEFLGFNLGSEPDYAKFWWCPLVLAGNYVAVAPVHASLKNV
jgi:hypothetical protein